MNENSAKANDDFSYADDDFWAGYRSYVDECWPRHLRAVTMLRGWSDRSQNGSILTGAWELGRVLDLGCGQVMEASRLRPLRSEYVGVEKDLVKEPNGYTVLRYDYRTQLDQVAEELARRDFRPNTVVSFFSVEPTGDVIENFGLYHQVFDTFPSVGRVISAGFYYEKHREQEKIEEPGGLVSWQTNHHVRLLNKRPETRLEMRAPSELFGADVIEVWRLIERGDGWSS